MMRWSWPLVLAFLLASTVVACSSKAGSPRAARTASSTATATGTSSSAHDASWAARQLRPLLDAVVAGTPSGPSEVEKLVGLYGLFLRQTCSQDEFGARSKADYIAHESKWAQMLGELAAGPNAQDVRLGTAGDTEIAWSSSSGAWSRDAVRVNSDTDDPYAGWRFTGDVCETLLR